MVKIKISVCFTFFLKNNYKNSFQRKLYNFFEIKFLRAIILVKLNKSINLKTDNCFLFK